MQQDPMHTQRFLPLVGMTFGGLFRGWFEFREEVG